MKWYLKVLENYFNFHGRARRKEYWMYILFNIIFGCFFILIDGLIGTTFTLQLFSGPQATEFGYFEIAYRLALLIPGLAVTVRRLHDTGKSGWSVFILLIPIFGWIWFLVFLCSDGDADENRFGPDPKNLEASFIVDTNTLDSDILL